VKPINVGLLGIGTVGGGTWEVLNRNADEIRRRAGRGIRITRVADKALPLARKIVGKKAAITANAFEVTRAKDVEIVVELIGGYTVAKDLVLDAIRHGKHVVTANKALLATHGNEIFAAAQKQGVMVAFEASVAGGIPIIKALREGLAANRIEWIAGIINGTSNFILSEMPSPTRRRAATRKPTRRSTSRASTPRTSSRSSRRSRSASRCSSGRPIPRASRS
jgi:homoserine dehydrogenase